MEEWVGILVGLNALVENGDGSCEDGIEECLARAMRHLSAHQNPHLLEGLPLTIEGEQSADLEVARGDVE